MSDPAVVVENVPRNLKRDLLVTMAAAELLPHRYRTTLLRRAGIQVGRNVSILAGFRIQGDADVVIGEDCSFNREVFFDARAPIVLEQGAGIGSHCRLITSTHTMGPSEQRSAFNAAAPITMERGSWITTGVTVFGGVTIGRGAVVGAGAVVTHDCEPDTLYLGIPARPVKKLP